MFACFSGVSAIDARKDCVGFPLHFFKQCAFHEDSSCSLEFIKLHLFFKVKHFFITVTGEIFGITRHGGVFH